MQESEEAANEKEDDEVEGTEIDFAIPVDPQNLQHNPFMGVWHGISIAQMHQYRPDHIGRVCLGPAKDAGLLENDVVVAVDGVACPAGSAYQMWVDGADAAAAAPPTIHPGVVCDKSGMDPIVGTRYTLTGEDYDLCQAEYDKLPAAEQLLYTAIPPAVAARHLRVCRPDAGFVGRVKDLWRSAARARTARARTADRTGSKGGVVRCRRRSGCRRRSAGRLCCRSSHA